eukprot:1144147-Pelagomonas_calceolata.AAC.1
MVPDSDGVFSIQAVTTSEVLLAIMALPCHEYIYLAATTQAGRSSCILRLPTAIQIQKWCVDAAMSCVHYGCVKRQGEQLQAVAEGRFRSANQIPKCSMDHPDIQSGDPNSDPQGTPPHIPFKRHQRLFAIN